MFWRFDQPQLWSPLIRHAGKTATSSDRTSRPDETLNPRKLNHRRTRVMPFKTGPSIMEQITPMPRTIPTATIDQWRLWTFYVLMLVGTLGLFFIIREYGETLTMPAVAAAGQSAVQSHASVAHRSDTLLHVLLALVAMIVTGRLLGLGFRYLGQPPVIGEVIAGILLGPSLLGRISPELAGYLLPASIVPTLGMIAQLGVILYMFVVGLELDTSASHSRGHSTVAISHASIVTPFTLGSLLALFLFQRFAEPQISFTVFSLFLGAAMSVTAFPVLFLS